MREREKESECALFLVHSIGTLMTCELRNNDSEMNKAQRETEREEGENMREGGTQPTTTTIIIIIIRCLRSGASEREEREGVSVCVCLCVREK
jgi:hypothetical protein